MGPSGSGRPKDEVSLLLGRKQTLFSKTTGVLSHRRHCHSDPKILIEGVFLPKLDLEEKYSLKKMARRLFRSRIMRS